MVAAITAMPPPCGVGTVCEERALGLASAMRCSQRPDRDDDRDGDRDRQDESGDCGYDASKLAAPWLMRSLTAKALPGGIR